MSSGLAREHPRHYTYTVKSFYKGIILISLLNNYKISQFFLENLQKNTKFNLKDKYVPVSVKIPYLHKNMPYISSLYEQNFMIIQSR